MERRLTLDAFLKSVFGSRVNYYFQPPTGLMINYPALIYRLDGIQDAHADDRVYNRRHAYYILLILDDPDTDLVDMIDDLPYCRMAGRPYTVDNLYHYPFVIYY